LSLSRLLSYYRVILIMPLSRLLSYQMSDINHAIISSVILLN